MEGWRAICKGTFLIQTTCQVPGVVREEALVVQCVAQQLRKGSDAHRSAMVVLVRDISHLHQLLQRADVSLEACRN